MSAARSILDWLRNSIADAGLSFSGSLAGISLKKLCRELISERGEASGTAIAREIAERYANLDPRERASFFEGLLASNWLADPNEVLKAAKAYQARQGAAELSKLFHHAEPRHMELFRRINAGPQGTQTIIKMREDLLALLKEHPDLEPLNADLVYLLSSWFNRGFLELRRINWRTPPVILEKLIQYEAVHEIQGWPDLKRRLADDRRCFAFFHPALPDEPLIFVQVALTQGIPQDIGPLLDIHGAPGNNAKSNTATFYSISNCQEGLRHISFGSFLLKQVIHELKHEDLRVKNFVTLSPVPGFRAWLGKQAPALASLEEADPSHRDELTRWCARYLTSKVGNRAADPVQHFHLSNGASVEQINWMGDKSAKGMRQSLGFMVNYSYRLSRIESNHESYVKEGALALSNKVQEILGHPPKQEPA
ncbi:MAG: malonyl-CoA decarboxylase [Acidobacteriota bacterium]